MNLPQEKKVLFGEKHYWMIAFEATFAYLIDILAGGVYFAKLTTSIGISDASTAILGAIGNFTALLSIFAIYIARRRRVKPIVATMHFTYQLLITILFLLPTLSLRASTMEILFVGVLIVSRLLSPLYGQVKGAWYQSNIPNAIRGSFGGVYQAISAISAMFITYAASRIIDVCESRGNLIGGFRAIAILVLVIAILDLITVLLTHETPTEDPEGGTPKISLFSEVGAIWKIPACKYFIIKNSAWQIAAVFMSAFQGTYLIIDLGVSMTTISLIGIYQYIIHFVSLLLSGRLAKRYRLSTLLSVGMFIDALSVIPLCLLSDKMTIPVYMLRITLQLLGASIYSVGHMIYYRILPRELYTAFNVTSSIPTCLIAFFTTLALTPFFNYLKYTLGGELFGIKIFAQQTLAILGVFCAIPVWIFIWRVLMPSVRDADKPLSEQEHVVAAAKCNATDPQNAAPEEESVVPKPEETVALAQDAVETATEETTDLPESTDESETENGVARADENLDDVAKVCEKALQVSDEVPLA